MSQIWQTLLYFRATDIIHLALSDFSHHPKYLSFHTKVSRLILVSSVFGFIFADAISYPEMVALSEWHVRQNGQIKESSQGSLAHCSLSLSTVYIQSGYTEQCHPASQLGVV